MDHSYDDIKDDRSRLIAFFEQVKNINNNKEYYINFYKSNKERFIKNFESRIYAQLSRQLVDQLFGENPAEEGSFQLFDNLITWTSDGISITMTIFNESTGETTTITIPIGDFGF